MFFPLRSRLSVLKQYHTFFFTSLIVCNNCTISHTVLRGSMSWNILIKICWFKKDCLKRVLSLMHFPWRSFLWAVVHLNKNMFYTKKTFSLPVHRSHGITNKNKIQTSLIKNDWCSGKTQKVETENHVSECLPFFMKLGPKYDVAFGNWHELWGLNIPGDLWQLPLFVSLTFC